MYDAVVVNSYAYYEYADGRRAGSQQPRPAVGGVHIESQDGGAIGYHLTTCRCERACTTARLLMRGGRTQTS